jgi:hypothetical protein
MQNGLPGPVFGRSSSTGVGMPGLKMSGLTVMLTVVQPTEPLVRYSEIAY